MTRGWWGWLGWMRHEERVSGDLAGERGTDGDECHRGSSRPAERLTAPQGRIPYVCLTPAGGKSAHDTEQQAANRAAQSAGAVWYPATIEEDESA